MRCIERSDPPQDADGQPLQFKRYQDATPHLKSRLGRYCSFCERKVAVSLAVEHKAPKSAAPQFETDWQNFLLACSNCNGVKGSQVVDDAAVLWPDRDNTLAAFEYQPSGRIRVAPSLPAGVRARAERLLALVGLDRGPGETPSDHRWFDRLEVWSLAQQSVIDLDEAPLPAITARIAATAAATGGYSIWIAAFASESDVQDAMCASFPGTVQRAPWADVGGPR